MGYQQPLISTEVTSFQKMAQRVVYTGYVTYISDDLDQIVCSAARIADTLHGREQVWRRVTQQHTDFVCLTSD